MINVRKSIFKKNTHTYQYDSVFNLIDIEEALKKNKIIEKANFDNFIYKKYLEKQDSVSQDFNFITDEFNFTFDNGKIEKFSQYFEILSVIGEGSFGKVISAIDKKNKNKKVAVKVKYHNKDNEKEST